MTYHHQCLHIACVQWTPTRNKRKRRSVNTTWHPAFFKAIYMRDLEFELDTWVLKIWIFKLLTRVRIKGESLAKTTCRALFPLYLLLSSWKQGGRDIKINRKWTGYKSNFKLIVMFAIVTPWVLGTDSHCRFNFRLSLPYCCLAHTTYCCLKSVYSQHECTVFILFCWVVNYASEKMFSSCLAIFIHPNNYCSLHKGQLGKLLIKLCTMFPYWYYSVSL